MQKRSFLTLAAACALAAVSPLRGQATAGEAAQSVNALVSEVMQSSPSLEAARLRWEAARERPDIVSALPDPMLQYGYFLQNVETRVGAMNQKITLSQKVPLFNKRSLAASEAEKEALMQMWDYQQLGRELILRAKLAYIDLFRIERSQAILREQQDLLDSIGSTAQARYETGRSPQQDLLKIRVAMTDLQARLVDLQQQREIALARLNALRAKPADTPFKVERSLDVTAIPSRAEALAVGQRYRQELQAAGVMIERNEIALKLARKDRLPDLTFGVDYTQVNESTMSNPSDNGQDAVMGFVALNLPIWGGKLRAKEQQALKQLAASRASRRQAELSLQNDVSDALARARAAQDQLTLYDASLLPAARQTLDATQSGYESGGAGFIDLIDSERALLNLQLGRVMAEADRAKAVAMLERAVGVDIEQINNTNFANE